MQFLGGVRPSAHFAEAGPGSGSMRTALGSKRAVRAAGMGAGGGEVNVAARARGTG